MKRLRTALCALCLALLVPLLLRASRILPLDTRPLVAEKYAGWSGVLRLWVYEGWPWGADSPSPWLNRCVARFEKAHPGVYIQPRFVDAGAIASLNDSGILPPDMILFPPGLMDSPEALEALEPPAALRPALARCGMWGGRLRAVPVAMGGYAWAWNAALLDGIPDDWRSDAALPAVPPPEDHRRWDAALLALCRGRRADTPDGSAPPSQADLSDMDLGLTLRETPAPSPTPAPGVEIAFRRLPEGFDFDGDARRRFVNGDAAATLVTQREIRRLRALSAQGRGPDWRLSADGSAFTDQLLFWGLVRRPDADAQRALCLQFLDDLLSEEDQGELSRAGAFGVTDAPSGYEAGDPLARLDAALRDPALVVPNAFDGLWPETAGKIVRDFIAGAAEPEALWRRFAGLLSENPNIAPATVAQ